MSGNPGWVVVDDAVDAAAKVCSKTHVDRRGAATFYSRRLTCACHRGTGRLWRGSPRPTRVSGGYSMP